MYYSAVEKSPTLNKSENGRGSLATRGYLLVPILVRGIKNSPENPPCFVVRFKVFRRTKKQLISTLLLLARNQRIRYD